MVTRVTGPPQPSRYHCASALEPLSTHPTSLEVPVVQRSNGGGRSAVATRPRQQASARPSPQPLTNQRARELQRYGSVTRMPIGLDQSTCKQSVDALNQTLADTITIRDLYKKSHWQVAGHTFYQLHLLFDKHYEEQDKLVDQIAERIQLLGGISLAMGADVAEETRIPRPPRGREEVPVQISRLLEAHELILTQAREAAEAADEAGDAGTNDLLVSNVIRTNEMQAWFTAEHVVDAPVVEADGDDEE